MLAPELRGLIVSLPKAAIDDYVAVVEVLVQVGLPNFAVPVRAEAFAELRAIFGRRARFAASGVASVDDAARAAELGAELALADVADPAIGETARERQLPVFLSAMTPAEVRAVLATGAGALLYPADVVGHMMGHRLAALGLVQDVIPAGGIGAYAAGEWFKAGAPAVCVDSTLLGDAFSGGSLAKLRDRSNTFVAAHRKAVDG